MTLTPDDGPIRVSVAEWKRIGPDKPELRGRNLDPAGIEQAKALGNKLIVRPTFGGLEVEATSFVGHVAVGPLRIAVRPKLEQAPLTTLLRYAYGLRDLGPLRTPTDTPVDALGLQDILVALLAEEADELLHRGLSRHYVPREDRLESPRGRILVGALARNGGVVEARLPCRYVERRVDWRLNQVLRAGLRLASHLAQDAEVRRRVQRLDAALDGVAHAPLDREAVDEAERGLTRLTEAYRPALTLVRLLLDAQGIDMEDGRPRAVPGFLFDMNSFFERLVSRFLHDNLPPGWRIVDQRSVRGLLRYAPEANPNGRSAPSVRPDYALHEPGHPVRFLDAKYRDVWTEGCTAEWLYQLSLYALAGAGRVSVLLYATTHAAAREERLEVRPGASDDKPVAATVIIRPVDLTRISELIGPGQANTHARERQGLALALVAG